MIGTRNKYATPWRQARRNTDILIPSSAERSAGAAGRCAAEPSCRGCGCRCEALKATASLERVRRRSSSPLGARRRRASPSTTLRLAAQGRAPAAPRTFARRVGRVLASIEERAEGCGPSAQSGGVLFRRGSCAWHAWHRHDGRCVFQALRDLLADPIVEGKRCGPRSAGCDSLPTLRRASVQREPAQEARLSGVARPQRQRARCRSLRVRTPGDQRCEGTVWGAGHEAGRFSLCACRAP